MSNINIFELDSVQDLNEKEVSNVVGGLFTFIKYYKDYTDYNHQVQDNPTVVAQNQSAFGSGAKQNGSGNNNNGGQWTF